MEQSRGKFGITVLDAYGPYRMPKNLWEYGLNEYNQNNSTPDGSGANSRMEPDVDALWKAAEGDIKKQYDAILRIYAGYDETGVWQEFRMRPIARMAMTSNSNVNGTLSTTRPSPAGDRPIRRTDRISTRQRSRRQCHTPRRTRASASAGRATNAPTAARVPKTTRCRTWRARGSWRWLASTGGNGVVPAGLAGMPSQRWPRNTAPRQERQSGEYVGFEGWVSPGDAADVQRAAVFQRNRVRPESGRVRVRPVARRSPGSA